MSDDGIAEARAALAAIDGLAAAAEDAAITRLGGLTNRVFRVEAAGAPLCLRLAGAGTEEYINRVHELEMAQLTAAADISPEVLHADPATGLMITRFVDDAVTMTPELFKSRAGAPSRAAEAFARLHASGATFPFRFEPLAVIDDYMRVLATKTTEMPQGFDAVLREIEAARVVLTANPAPLVPSHCDPLCENFLDSGSRMWVVDWEYAGMNEAMWDLGDLSVEAGFDADQDEEMLRAYFGREATPAERGRMVIYKAMCDLLWTVWGLIQHANNNPVDDFWAYSINRYDRCRALMASPEYPAGLAALG